MGAVSEKPHVPTKLRVEKVSEGGVEYVRIRGIIDQSFDGKKLAAALSERKLIVDLKETRRISSSGVPPWLDFLNSRVHSDVYLVECAPHVISQLNMMSSLAGDAKVVSFFAPYRCHQCTNEFDVRFLVPRDRGQIREFMPPQQPCPKCGSASDLDDDPHNFLAGIAARSLFDIDAEVMGFLRTRLKYDLAPEANRLRILRYTAGKMTYLRVNGPIDRSFPADALGRSVGTTTVVDLSGAALSDQPGVSEWRAFMRSANPFLTRLFLYECPVGFLERTLLPEDLDEKLRVLSFQMPYHCPNCGATVTRSIDVEAQHANLRVAGGPAFPDTPCESCKTAMKPTTTEAQQLLLRVLPKPGFTPDLRRFLVKATERDAAKLDDLFLTRRPRGESSKVLVRVGYITVSLAVVILGVVALTAWRVRGEQPAAAQVPAGQAAPGGLQPKFERPSWIISDAPSSASCHDLINLMMCVGVSSYQGSREEALVEANDAALDELANSVGLRIVDERFQQAVVPTYQDARASALFALETAIDRTSEEYKKAHGAVKGSRHRVAEVLRGTGGAAVPAQRSDWYWEEYRSENGQGSEFLVFVRYDISLDAVKSLVQKYSAPITVFGSAALTVFPSVAWRYPEVTGGAMILSPAASLADAGVGERDIVTAVQGTPVRDTNELTRELGRHKGEVAQLSVSGGKDAAQRTVPWKVHGGKKDQKEP